MTETVRITIGKGGASVSISDLPLGVRDTLVESLTWDNPRYSHDIRIRGKSRQQPNLTAYSESTDGILSIPFGSIQRLISAIQARRSLVEFDDQTFPEKLVPFKFTGKLKGNQWAALNSIFDYRYCQISAPPGWGKRHLVSTLLDERRVPTLIIVKTIRDLHLWREHLLANGIREDQLGLIGDRRCQTDAPLLVAIDRSLWRSLPDIKYDISQVIIPRANIANQKIFARGIGSFPCRYVLALRDAPRTDGLDSLVASYCGPIRYHVRQSEMSPSGVGGGKVMIRRTNWDYNSDSIEIDFADIIKAMTSDNDRNIFILMDLLEALADDTLRSVLISDRVSHLAAIQDLICEQHQTASLVHGNIGHVTEKSIINSWNRGKLRMVLCSARSIEILEHLKGINRLFLTTPIKNPQIISFLLSVIESDSIIFDYLDIPQFCVNSYKRRRKFYLDRQFKEI